MQLVFLCWGDAAVEGAAESALIQNTICLDDWELLKRLLLADLKPIKHGLVTTAAAGVRHLLALILVEGEEGACKDTLVDAWATLLVVFGDRFEG